MKKALLHEFVLETQEKDFGNRSDVFLGILFTSILMCELKMNESASRNLIYHFKMLPLENGGRIKQ